VGEWEGEIEGEGERGVGLWGGRERRRGRRAYPCIMLSRLTTRHPFGLSSACDHSSTLNRCWPGGGRGCAASGPGEPFTTLSLGGGGAFMTPHAARHTALPPPPRAHQLAVARPPAPPPAGTDGNTRAGQMRRWQSGWRRSEKAGQGWQLAVQAASHLVQRLVCWHRAGSLPRCNRRHARHTQHHGTENAASLVFTYEET
jgi:hypothetical protein